MEKSEPKQQSFASWHASAAGLVERGDVDVEPPADAPFPIASGLNRRVVLTSASQPWALEVDALVLGNNEALSDRLGVQGEVFSRGGRGLAEEVEALGTVRTGEARLTCGHGHGAGLAPRHLVHAIGPKYVPKYAQAAGSALHWAYRHALQLCHAHQLRTLALLPLHDADKKHYPPSDGAHVALRTLRRFLEKHANSFDALLLLLPTDAHVEAYNKLMPLYFPRT